MSKMEDGKMVTARDAEDDVLNILEKYKAELARVLPKYVSPDRLARIATTSLRANPKLFSCTKGSLFSCIMQVATLNLEPDTLLQHAHLIPYGRECTLVIGYRGMRELVERAGKVSHIEARAVFEGDEFGFSYGTEPEIHHVPGKVTQADKLSHAYAVIVFKTGLKKFDVMTRAEIDAISNRSKARDSGPWKTDFAEMAKKTVLRRALKAEPMSGELSRAIALDEQVDANLPQRFEVPWSDVEAARESPINTTPAPIPEPAPTPEPAPPAEPVDMRVQIHAWMMELCDGDELLARNELEQLAGVALAAEIPDDRLDFCYAEVKASVGRRSQGQ